MTKSHNKNESLLRRQRNLDMVKRMKNGDALTLYDSKDSWYPPRPIIKKDVEIAQKLHTASGALADRPSKQTGKTTMLKVVDEESNQLQEIHDKKQQSNIISLRNLPRV